MINTYVTFFICSSFKRVFCLRSTESSRPNKVLPQLIRFHIKLLNDFPHIQFVADIQWHYIPSSQVSMSKAVSTEDQRYRPLLVNTWKSVAGNKITFWLQCHNFHMCILYSMIQGYGACETYSMNFNNFKGSRCKIYMNFVFTSNCVGVEL